MGEEGGAGRARFRMGSRPGLVAVELAGPGSKFCAIYTPALAAELLEDLVRADEARDWGLSFTRKRSLADVGPEPYGSGSAGWLVRVMAGPPGPVLLALARPGEPSPVMRLNRRYADFVSMLRRTIDEAGRGEQGPCN